MQDRPEKTEEARRKAKRRWPWALLLLLLLLLLRGCPEDQPFDYFRHRATELDGDPDRVLAFVRDEIETVVLRGDGRGALGALWNGAGTPEEKRLLLEAIWAHCDPARSDATLDDVAPDRDPTGDAGDDAGQTFAVTIEHQQWVGTAPGDGSDEAWEDAFEAAEVIRTEVYRGAVSALVGDVHSVSVPEIGTTLIEVRARNTEAGQERVATPGALGEALVFRVDRPTNAAGEPRHIVRELWRADNRIGPAATGAGDRHDFVVLPCRVSEFVCEKEKLILKEAGRADAPEAHPYEGLLDYARGSDELLEELEQELGVRALFETPRILILSTLATEAEPGVVAFDLRLNETTFSGEPVDAYAAAHVRSLLESGLEHEWLQQWTGSEVRSAFETFQRLYTVYPDSTDRRVELIFDSLEALREHGGEGAQATFTVGGPAGGTGMPSVVAQWTGDGYYVNGGDLAEEYRNALAASPRLPDESALQFDGSRIDQTFSEAGWAAWAIETAILGSQSSAALPPDYVLAADLATGRESLVVPSARFVLEWGAGNASVRQWVQVTALKEQLEYTFHTRKGLRMAAGNLTVEHEALVGATRHNPHYQAGTSTQSDATSFCVSRAVHGALAQGRSSPLELLARREKEDDPLAPRRVEWSGALEEASRDEIVVLVNGKETPVPVLRAVLSGETPPFAELAVLDDVTWPVGRADDLVSIDTAVRGRLVDEKGLGIGGAHVQLGESAEGPSCVTWPDGRFRLPPVGGEERGVVTLQVQQKVFEDVQTDLVETDLTSIGLDEVKLAVVRLRHRVIWIAPHEVAKLEELPLSAQVRRHARNELQSDRMVVIPERMISDGLYGVTGDGDTSSASDSSDSGFGARSTLTLVPIPSDNSSSNKGAKSR